MGNRQFPGADATTAPQSDIEIQDARSPAASCSPPEFALDALQLVKHFPGAEFAFDECDGVGEVASGASVCGVQEDWRRIKEAEILVEASNGCLDHPSRTSEASVRSVGTKSDREEVRCRGHARSPRSSV